VATQILQGAGMPLVDMNQYNVPLDRIVSSSEEEEGGGGGSSGLWTAQMVQKTGKGVMEDGNGIFLRTNANEVFVDSVTVTFPRRLDSGLGIGLMELAGGRDDGLGITIVSSIIPNSAADGTDILPGDSVTQVTVIRRGSNNSKVKLEEKEEYVTVPTECLSYDATVEAIGSLPPAQEGDVMEVTLKRLRYRPKMKVHLRYPPEQNEPDETITMYAGENLRQGMLIRGVKLNDPLAQRFDTKSGGNCGAGGLCRTCSISVLRGKQFLNPQRLAEEQMLKDVPSQWRLACKAIVGYGMKEGEITIQVNPRQW
jgi:ferredoxin